MPNDSLPELELHNVRTRERLQETVARIRRKSDVPARWRLLQASTRQQLHRDPTPLVAMAVTAAAGVAAIVVGITTRGSEGMHTATAGRAPVLLPTFTPAKTRKDGTSKRAAKFARVPDKNNPVETRKSRKKAAKQAAKAAAKNARK